MSIKDKINALNNWNPRAFVSLFYSGKLLGHIERKNVNFLKPFPEVFEFLEKGHVAFRSDFVTATFEQRSALMQEIANVLRQNKPLIDQHWRSEAYGIYEDFSSVERKPSSLLFILERALVPFFGFRAYGVHLNGLVQDANDNIKMWIATRSIHKTIAPLKKDQLVAGGQPYHLSLIDNLVKECAEEAAIPEDLARKSQIMGALQYCYQDERGLHPDVLYCFDLFLPPDFEPKAMDGEVEDFHLYSLSDVADLACNQDLFKPNSGLVVIDYLQRQKLI